MYVDGRYDSNGYTYIHTSVKLGENTNLIIRSENRAK